MFLTFFNSRAPFTLLLILRLGCYPLLSFSFMFVNHSIACAQLVLTTSHHGDGDPILQPVSRPQRAGKGTGRSIHRPSRCVDQEPYPARRRNQSLLPPFRSRVCPNVVTPVSVCTPGRATSTAYTRPLERMARRTDWYCDNLMDGLRTQPVTDPVFTPRTP